ncbi:MAG: phosphomannose isomerase type II C-terminal cupin domain [Candidatus Paceibacterota bacterium]|jgi:mannose-6-phosphate isomerase-like protein (cupin superfamily)
MTPFTEKRPWGEFRQFTLNEPVTVKTILVKKGEALSLQNHHLRTEFWKIISGHPEVTIGEKIFSAKAGDEFTVGIKTNHKIEAPKDEVLLLEISSGEFKEDDIVRLSDKYGRA